MKQIITCNVFLTKKKENIPNSTISSLYKVSIPTYIQLHVQDSIHWKEISHSIDNYS